MTPMNLPEFLAAIPYLIGYQPDHDSVVVAGLREGHMQFSATIPLGSAPPIDNDLPAHDTGSKVSRVIRQERVDAVIVVGYGPRGDQNTGRLLAHLIDAPITIEIHIDNEQYRRRSSPDEPWTSPSPLPAAPDHGAAWKLPDPSAGRTQHLEKYQPHPQTGFQPLPRERGDLLDALMPSLRAEIGVRTLDRIALTHDPDDMALLAHLIGTTLTQAHVLHATISNPHRRQALIDTYRAAPAPHLADLATLASAGHYLSGGSTATTHEILHHAHPDSPLTQLLTAGIAADVPGRELHNLFTARHGLDRLLHATEAADQAWETTQHRHETPTPPHDPAPPPRKASRHSNPGTPAA